jgi:NADH:ubiquinone oxidoreductase subunit K
MMIAGIVGALGLISIISKKSFLGLLIGIQILTLGSSMMFIFSGSSDSAVTDS